MLDCSDGSGSDCVGMVVMLDCSDCVGSDCVGSD